MRAPHNSLLCAKFGCSEGDHLEWNLAANWHEHDVRNAEFIRTYRSADFPGGQLVRRLEAERSRDTEAKVVKALPALSTVVSTDPMYLRHFVDLYGFSGGCLRTFQICGNNKC